MKKHLLLLIPLIIVVWLSTKWVIPSYKAQPVAYDFDSILSRGRLIVSTSNNPTDYFLYKGEPKGFQFELLQELGNYLGLKVEILVNNDPSQNENLLKSGECDLIASSWNYSKSTDGITTYSVPLLETELVLVQRKSSEVLMNTAKNTTKLIRDPQELCGKSVFVPVQSVEAQLVKQINYIKQNKVRIYEMPLYSQEKLVNLVATGEIDYTICNNILAHSLKMSHPELDFETIIKKAEPIVWNFRKTSPLLTEKINQWIHSISGSARFVMLTEKYFNNREQWFPSERKFNPASSGKISAYDHIIRKYSQYINWDWRLLASLIYQESRFRPTVRSHRGAWGLMQMMPITQTFFGIDSTASPELQILAGVRYIKYLDKAFSKLVADPQERIHFILASYNVGPGHIIDAQKIARKKGKNPHKWFNNVDSCLISKSEYKYYSDPDILFGNCKGYETNHFVTEVLSRYQHYRNVLKK